jgi:hypothetical protein
MYNEIRGQKDMPRSLGVGRRDDVPPDGGDVSARPSQPVGDRRADAEQFIVSQQITAGATDPLDPDHGDCLTPQIRHLYDNIAQVVRERHAILPDVSDDASFLAQLRPDAQRQFGFDPRAPRVVTAAAGDEEELQRRYGRGGSAGRGDGYGDLLSLHRRCRVVGGLPDGEMRAIAAAFDDRTLTQASERYPKFAAYRRDCLH